MATFGRYESPYNGEGAVATGTSFILKHKTYNAYVGPKGGGATPINDGELLVWYNLGPPSGLSADHYYNYSHYSNHHNTCHHPLPPLLPPPNNYWTHDKLM